ncbi:MAG: hypothetical protein ACK5MP_05795 [Nostocoides sp.]
MSMSLAQLVTVASEGGHDALPMNANWYFVIAMVLFLLALGVTWSFRGAANKVRGSGKASGGHH